MDSINSTPIQYHFDSIPGWIAVFIALCLAIYMSWREHKVNQENKLKGIDNIFKEPTFRKNINWAFFWWWLICAIIASFYFFNIFHLDNGMHNPVNSKVDGIIWLMTIIGIIGALWAIFARIDAERAFEQAFKAREKAEETLNALGNSFNFYEMLNLDKFPLFIDKIGQDNTTVSLYLGFPCVGFLFQDKANFKNEPEDILWRLNRKLEDLNLQLTKKQISNFILNIGCFSKDETLKILNGRTIMLSKDNLIESFYKRLEDLKSFENKDERKNQVIIQDKFIFSEKLRFTSIYSSSSSQQNNKAFIWIVPDLKNDKGNMVSFDSAAFQTTDSKFISVLEKAFL